MAKTAKNGEIWQERHEWQKMAKNGKKKTAKNELLAMRRK
jgi:hypothetical protein